MAGSTKVGTMAGAGIAGAASIAAAKIVIKSGATKVGASSISKIGISTAGKYGAGTVGKVTAGTFSGRAGAVSYAEMEASNILKETGLRALKSNPTLLSEREIALLSRSYPELPHILKSSSTLDDYFMLHPELADDISLAIYKSNPRLFASQFQESILLRRYTDAFDNTINDMVTAQTSREANTIISNSLRRLEQDGIDISKLKSMEKANVEKLIADSIKNQLQSSSVNQSYAWGYKSGSLFVKGDIGHFSFEQEVAISSIVKMAVAGSVAVGGYKYGWSKNKFVRAHTCVGDFCLEVSKKQSGKPINKEAETGEKNEVRAKPEKSTE